jgi:hypothetical protein
VGPRVPRLPPRPADGAGQSGREATPEPERTRRVDLLCATYGPPADSDAVAAAVPERLDELRAFTLARARDGGPPELVDHAALYAADARYVRGRRGG